MFYMNDQEFAANLDCGLLCFLCKIIKVYHFQQILYTLSLILQCNLVYLYYEKILWLVYLFVRIYCYPIIILKFCMIFIRIIHSNFIGFNSVNFIIIASEAHLFFFYRFIVNAFFKSMKYQLFKCRIFHSFCLYKLRVLYFIFIFLYSISHVFGAVVANFVIILPSLLFFSRVITFFCFFLQVMVFFFFFHHISICQTILW